jgi:hypothetical protein
MHSEHPQPRSLLTSIPELFHTDLLLALRARGMRYLPKRGTPERGTFDTALGVIGENLRKRDRRILKMDGMSLGIIRLANSLLPSHLGTQGYFWESARICFLVVYSSDGTIEIKVSHSFALMHLRHNELDPSYQNYLNACAHYIELRLAKSRYD